MIELIILIAVVGLVVWAVTTYIPMPQPFKGIIIVVALLFLLIIVIRALGVDLDTSLN